MKPEIEEPDLWEATRSETLMSQAATAGDTDNKLLTPAERRYIVEQLRSIEEAVVKAHGLEQHQVDALNAGFQYLIDSSNRMGRKDWINLAIGTVVNIAVGAALAPAAANDLLHLLTGAFHGLVYSAVKLLASG